MRYCKLIIIVTLLGFCVSCNSNKKDEADPPANTDTTTMEGTGNAAAESTTIKKEATARSIDSDNNDRNTILANIDQYLISKPDISTATLTVENSLKDATIIKAYAEVTMVDAAGKNLRTDFLILEHIEPGESKSVRMPDVSNAVKVISNIVRLKSDELTNGETILVGSRYVPK
ncbi:MAG: hypothetical protein HOP10_15275 [Chitinophagaceae bacterium]|nr:hypothetical protein [Chitinophagaceae bacterium]